MRNPLQYPQISSRAENIRFWACVGLFFAVYFGVVYLVFGSKGLPVMAFGIVLGIIMLFVAAGIEVLFKDICKSNP